MAEYQRLEKAPIAEAIIDLRIKPALGDEVLPILSSIKDEIGDSYPICEKFYSYGGEFRIQESKTMVHTSKDVVTEGYIYKTADNRQIAQFRKNGFTFNNLNPYTRWEAILAEAQRLWTIYQKKASPEIVTRIAVRYINKMELPRPDQDFSEYLVEPPRIPDGIPNGANSYYSKIIIHDEKTDLSANIIQLIDKSIDPKNFTLILDNDIYKGSDYEAGSSVIWEVFSDLRKMKNTIFFATITEKTARLFK